MTGTLTATCVSPLAKPRQASGRSLVEIAHMEIARPSIAEAVANCVAGGATDVIIAPYFLSRCRAKLDSPHNAGSALHGVHTL